MQNISPDHEPRPRPNNFKSNSTGNWAPKEPEILYVNEKCVHRRCRRRDITESCTQTSKTILQLAKMETGYMSPDSLTSSPRRTSLENHCSLTESQHRLSEFTLDGSCPENDCVFNKEVKISKAFLTKAFLEKNRKKLKSKSFVESYHHPNYIKSLVKHTVRPVKLLSKPVVRSSMVCYHPQNSFMCPTASSQIKSKMPEIQSINQLIPGMRRGRSVSPRQGDGRNLECSRKIPYIDQSKSDVSSATTIVNTNRNPERFPRKKIFDEDLLKIDDLKLDSNSEEVVSFVTNYEANCTIDHAITSALSKFREPDWRIALRGLAELVELCRVVEIDLIYDYMPTINQRLIELLKSPRSHVCRTACQAAGHLFEYVKDTRRPEFDDLVDLLLFKTADSNKFIRHDANLALDCMVTHIATYSAVRALCAKGPFHKNNLVRCATVRLLVCVIVIAGPDFILSPSGNEFTKKRIVLNMARFLEDKNLETRKFGERLYKVLCKESRFDGYLKKYLEREQIVKMKKTLKIVHKK